MSDEIGKFTAHEWRAHLMGETLLFGLLGRVLYANPSRDWLTPLLENDLFDSVPFAGDQSDTTQGLVILAKWTSSVGNALTDEALNELRADYAQLFIGNTKMLVPPWESVYFSEDRLTFQSQTLDVGKAYERLSLRINTDNREPVKSPKLVPNPFLRVY